MAAKKKPQKKQTSTRAHTKKKVAKKKVAKKQAIRPITELADIKPVQRKKGQHAGPKEEELVRALFGISDNIAEISRISGLTREQIQRIKDEIPMDELQKIRAAKREGFVEEAWGTIMLALNSVKDGLVNGYIIEKYDVVAKEMVGQISTVGPGEAARVIRDVHHASQLAEGKPTSITDRLASDLPEDEIEKLIAEAEKELDEHRGRLN